jgi:hypothetical protein
LELDIFTEVILSLNDPREISREQFWSVRRQEFDGDLRMLLGEPDCTVKYLTVDNLITGQKEDIAIAHEGNNGDCLYWQQNQIYRSAERVPVTYFKASGVRYGRLMLGGFRNEKALSVESPGIFSEYIAQKYIRISRET